MQFRVAPNATPLLGCSRGLPPRTPPAHPHCAQGYGCGCGDSRGRLAVSPDLPDVDISRRGDGSIPSGSSVVSGLSWGLGAALRCPALALLQA